MGGLLQSVGNGIGGVVGGTANTIANMLGSIVHQTSQVVPGGFPVVVIVVIVVVGLVAISLIR
jgi:hypothetical protein